MIKYLSRKKNTYWYRRKIKGFGGNSLFTKNSCLELLKKMYEFKLPLHLAQRDFLTFKKYMIFFKINLA